MKSFLTLDYELFFGSKTGTPQKCLFEPTEALLQILRRYDITATFFVDVAYLDRASKYSGCQRDVGDIIKHLEYLQSDGHELQLHIHPHWYYSEYDAGKWTIDVSKYKLSDLPSEEASEVVRACSSKFSDIVGSKPLAYRAGGWCIDGFDSFAGALYDCGVRVDSTIYTNGRNISETQGYDFRGAPDAPAWRFSDNPLEKDPEGAFFELPITSMRLSNHFYWRQVLKRLIGKSNDTSYGDGRPTSMSIWQLAKYLTVGSYSVASIDGIKAGCLDDAFDRQQRKFGSEGYFVILGHPKALTPISLDKVDDFLARRGSELQFTTITDWYNSLDRRSGLHRASRKHNGSD